MSETEEDPPFAIGPGEIELRRVAESDGMPVLLLHGGSAHSGTFAIPNKGIDGKIRCLKDWLLKEEFDPWLLDWRASTRVIEKFTSPNSPSPERSAQLRNCFDLDQAAESDIPWALEKIQKARPKAERIGAIGHCLGAGALAQAIASGIIAKKKLPLTHVVLMTLGLYYRSDFWGVLKAQSNPLATLWNRHPNLLTVDPGKGPWPDELEEVYKGLFPPRTELPHLPRSNESKVYELCNRLSFMYGLPYKEEKLVPEIHEDVWTLSFDGGENQPQKGWIIEGEGSGAQGILLEVEKASGHWGMEDAEGVLWLKGPRDAEKEFEPKKGLRIQKDATGAPRRLGFCKKAIFEEAQLPQQFGAIPLKMYLQAVQNVVRRSDGPGGSAGAGGGLAGRFNDDLKGVGLVCEASLAYFRDVTTTLITGRENKLWQNDSVNMMHHFLSRKRKPGGVPDPVIISGYGHQDLLWGRSAVEDVFPAIEDALTRPVSDAASLSSSTNLPST